LKPLSLVIPAAGLGSRFRDAGYKTPKPLIEILGHPMLQWVFSNFSLSPIDQLIVISLKNDFLPAQLASHGILGSESIIFLELDQLTGGPAETVMRASSLIPDDNCVVVANSDQYLAVNTSEFINDLRAEIERGIILTMEATGSKWSYVGRDSLGQIDLVVEKRQISAEATVGIYGWSSKSLMISSIQEMIDAEDRTNGEFYVAPSYNYLINSNIPVEGVWIGAQKDAVYGLGTPEDLNYFLSSGIASRHVDAI